MHAYDEGVAPLRRTAYVHVVFVRLAVHHKGVLHFFFVTETVGIS